MWLLSYSVSMILSSSTFTIPFPARQRLHVCGSTLSNEICCNTLSLWITYLTLVAMRLWHKYVKPKLHQAPPSFYSFAAFRSPSQVVIFSLGLFVSCPVIFSLESIFSQPLNVTNRIFFCSRISSSPALPCFLKSNGDVNTPFLSSSRMLATC
jgi:hypothetical protein